MATLFDQLTAGFNNVRSPAGERARPATPVGQRLELRLPPGWPETQSLDWCLRQNHTIVAQGHTRSLAELPSDVRSQHVHVWTPANDTLLTQVRLPTRSRTQIGRALPYALEDQLLSSPEELHFTWVRKEGDMLSVAVTARERMRAWLEPLAEAGIQPESLAPVTLSHPCLENSWILSHADSESWVRTGPQSGFGLDAAEDGALPILLRKAIADAREHDALPQALVIDNPPADFDPEKWKGELGCEILVEQADFWSGTDSASSALNLLHDEFATRRQRGPLPRSLLPAVIMVLAWLVGTVIFTTVDWWRLSSRDDHLVAEMTQIFRQSFPHQANLVVDPYQQMQRNLASTHGSGFANGLSASLAQLAGALKGSPAGALQEVDYRDGALDIMLKLDSYKDLESVKSSLQAAGFSADMRNSTRDEKGVTARIHLTNSTSGKHS
jgi:general secretion pathway protein L